MYIITEKGVWSNDIIGLYEKKEDAEIAFNKCLNNQDDDYLSIYLSKIKINVDLEKEENEIEDIIIKQRIIEEV